MDGFELLCKKQGKVGAHKISRSVRNGSWFERSHMSLRDIMKLMSVWFGKCKQKFARSVCNVLKEVASD